MLEVLAASAPEFDFAFDSLKLAFGVTALVLVGSGVIALSLILLAVTVGGKIGLRLVHGLLPASGHSAASGVSGWYADWRAQRRHKRRVAAGLAKANALAAANRTKRLAAARKYRKYRRQDRGGGVRQPSYRRRGGRRR